MAKVQVGVGPRVPQVVILVGATGDLSQRKLLPGLFHLVSAGFIPGCRIIGMSLDNIDAARFKMLVRGALDRYFARKLNEPTGMLLRKSSTTFRWPQGLLTSRLPSREPKRLSGQKRGASTT